jgi:purine nucleosidase/pyrimidine-specific ribonucleoside hydrolase
MTSPTAAANRPTPIILDCDPGHDDAFAIMLAAAHPAIELRAVTTVSGNGSVDKVTENARRVCTMAGLLDTVIARGADQPLVADAEAAVEIHGESALDGAELPEPRVSLSPLPAVEQMVEIIESSDVPVTLVATAPLTNVATLLRDHPDTAAKLTGISLMGGSATRGNWRPYAEFNIWGDPEAAEIVVNSGLPIRLTGLDVTHQALATAAVLDELRAQNTVLSQICVDLLLFFADTYRTVFGMPDPPLHDPLAVLAVAHPDWMTWQRCNVAIETTGRYTRGATVIDLDGVTGAPPNVDVARSLDVDRFWRLMLDSVAKLGDAPEGGTTRSHAS